MRPASVLEAYRVLAEGFPQRPTPAQAASLNNLANHLSEVGDRKALELKREARQLAG